MTWWDDYNRYLMSPEWREKRAKVLRKAKYRCKDCGGRAQQVHHKTYKRLGNERLSDLVALCDTCHKKRHDKRPWWKRLIGLSWWKRLIGLS